MRMLKACGSWEAGLWGRFPVPDYSSVFLDFFKLPRHTDLELLIKNPSSLFEQRTYYCLFTWAKQSLWRNGGVGPAGRGFHPLPGSLREFWHLLVKQEPPQKMKPMWREAVLSGCAANWPHRDRFIQMSSSTRQHMVTYQNYEVWLNGLLIFCFAYYLYPNSFRPNGERISALLISSFPKCQMGEKKWNTLL